ncbi:MAG: hypothetical protein A3I68_02720 [Candidatus Melainabacteria bacterium RIFCSPLOWO2_02_FULL_35_15]|nr:MAG: hypothetical protein A3F80_02315 [Candidatus Melainabacteria bacterium RIFCSPLOWO2_12_FULL_35_11]OGI13045.1 MAG: hypothetical protein A3I68_02720 [Candidatus Melainabacteria bacterium RIFCSPLOWO2_02_FULL_35_15]
MKRYYLILIIIFGCLFALQANAIILKNPFHKQKSTKPSISPSRSSDPLKAKAVYLELEGDSVEYDHDSNVYITSGMSIAHIVDQDAKLEADEIIYYGSDQHIEAKGNIKINRDNIITTGESFKFDVTSNKYLLTKPFTQIKGAIIKARTLSSLPDNNQLEYEHGRLKLEEPVRVAQGFGTRVHPKTFYSLQASRAARRAPTWDEVSNQMKYRITAQKIVYDQSKAVNNLTVYGGRIHFRNFSLPAEPRFTTTVSSDPNVRTAPLIAPVIGTQGALGGFAAGPAFNFNVTDHHIFSFSPFAQIGSGGSPGFGGMLGFYGPTTTLQLSYGSLKDRFIGQFRQKFFGNKTEFRAAYNYYLEEGFLGSTLAQINVGLVDKRRWTNSFLQKVTEGGINFRSSTSWIQSSPGILPSKYKGFLKEAGDPEDFKKTAFKAEEQINLISKPVFKIGTEKYNTALRFRTRNAFRAYSTGDFQGVFTGGPVLDNNLGPVTFALGYDQGYVRGKSPLFYDQYIQGMQSVSLDGDVKLSEWVTLGGFGTYNLKIAEVVEKQVRAKVGPKDFKMLVNWDALRQQTQFGLNFLFGQPVDFEKFVILNSQNKSGGI